MDAEIKYHDAKAVAENVLCNTISLPSTYSGNVSFEKDKYLKILWLKKKKLNKNITLPTLNLLIFKIFNLEIKIKINLRLKKYV